MSTNWKNDSKGTIEDASHVWCTLTTLLPNLTDSLSDAGGMSDEALGAQHSAYGLVLYVHAHGGGGLVGVVLVVVIAISE